MIRTVTNYTLNVVTYNNYSLTLPDFTILQAERFIRAYDLTQGIILYEINPSEFRSGDITISGNVVTFNLPSNIVNGDLVHIEYDDPSYDIPITAVDGNATIITSGTAVPLTSTSTPCKTVCVAANNASGTIVVGGSDVKAAVSGRKGIPVSTSGTSINISDAKNIYVDSTANGDTVSWMVVA